MTQMSRTTIVILAVAAGVVAVGAVTAASTVRGGPDGTDDPAVPTSTENTREPGEVSEEWTEERMAEAEPG